MHSSTHKIRRRLFLLLLRAFAIVLTLSFLFFILVTGYFLVSASTPIPFPFASKLEGYYLGHGSWEGVEVVFDLSGQDGLKQILLDEEKRIVLDRRPDSVSTIGTSYDIHPKDVTIDLIVNDEQVGYLVITAFSFSTRLGFARAILFPVGMVSFVLALFLVVVATLLVRRFVNPLADVIFAARAVADGKLDTRISSEGPQDLHSLAESFNEMATSLERNDRERRDMLADIAHELRTPLSVIRGRLEGIVDGIYPASGLPVSTALEQTYLLERLVDDLRLLTLAESRQLHFESKPVDLGNLSQRVLDLFQAEASEKYISLSLERLSENSVVEADAQRIEQVIANLVGNALRYVPEHGRVWIEISSDEKSVKLAVNDNGVGIPADDLPFIFDRFWRKDKSRSRISGGTGLGLAISKHLTEAQGGKIDAQNLSGGGLSMQITFQKK
ncbi:MAG: HAMP domain-containing protein [Anaerolineales bacterium]|nr:HAMP domain-containing protein [Anaerolineales bacterium]